MFCTGRNDFIIIQISRLVVVNKKKMISCYMLYTKWLQYLEAMLVNHALKMRHYKYLEKKNWKVMNEI